MLCPKEAPRWYLIQCKPREDGRALENLERQRFQCYRPVQCVERRRGGRKVRIEEALFPGYLFVRLDSLTDNWYPIRSTRGVHRIVRFNEHPLPVADEIIDAIRSRSAHPDRVAHQFRPGGGVRITHGPFSQLEAIFVTYDGDQRVILLLNILQSDQQLSFPLQNVRST